MAAGDRIEVARQNTLETVASLAQDINTLLGTIDDPNGIGSIVALLKKIDMHFPIIGGAKFEGYNNIITSAGGTTLTVPVNTWTTVFNVAGEGLLTKALLFNSIPYGVGTVIEIKLTVDGAVKFDRKFTATSATTGNVLLGLFQEAHVFGNTTPQLRIQDTYAGLNQAKQYSYGDVSGASTGSSPGIVVPIPGDLYFNTSIKLEVFTNYASGHTYNVDYQLRTKA